MLSTSLGRRTCGCREKKIQINGRCSRGIMEWKENTRANKTKQLKTKTKTKE